MIKPSRTRGEKNERKKRERKMLLPSQGVVDLTSRSILLGVELAVQVY